jgi:hypothetical protein
MGINTAPWIDERDQKPPLGKVVIIAVMRKAIRVDDGASAPRWDLANGERPIDLQQDTVYWMPDESG